MQMIKGNHEMRKGKVRRARGFIDPNILNAEVAKTQTQKDKVENAMAILNARLISIDQKSKA